MQGRFVTVELVQIADQLPDSVMQRLTDQRPIELDIVIPFGPLRDLAPHEQQFLTGLRVLVSVQQTQVGKLLPRIAGHLRQQRLLAVNDLVVRERKQKVFGEGVDHAERQFVLMVLAVKGIAAHVPQRVVHPAHVPLHAKAKSTGVNGPRHTAP